ncbi:lytic transglycosylase domain-containing protein [Curtobacterium sp. MCLR17_036]|uniref:coiled-coil domain-containing protein n=1 Tax=Curtobacterium sp. MCLR17_036 TaxID=2175620 RepID=UPI000DA7CEBE|nr:lytic transglycosylase domain-containing protein [Curtobacterium sp. MCLR17_036]WIE66096.1 lytic transglycosylase domain-containing protein [Curtobacterium sp. MCLR17_036]
MRLTPSRGVLVAAAVVVGALVAPALTAVPANATEYPTWQDVQRAKGNEAAKRVEVRKVQSALQAAQDEAAAKSQAALVASSEADAAEAELAEATQAATSLQAQAQHASETADRAQQRAGRLAANLYRDGSTNQMTTRIATAGDPDQLLYQLGALDQLSSTWSGVMDEASVAAGTASSLHEQAERAETERATRAQAAEERSAAAESAEQAADAAVDSTEQHSDELYAQLASLKDSTAEQQAGYELGQRVAAQKAEQQRKRAAAAAAEAARNAATPTNSSASSGGTGTSYPSTGGVVVDPAGAQSYARGAIGAYGWGGDQFSCLVSLWTQESGWRANALNASSGAYGIPQSLPADKMAAAGADWRTNAATQIDWGLAYIKSAYGSPCAAWGHEMSVDPHWY